jgi:hypothetical protein
MFGQLDTPPHIPMPPQIRPLTIKILQLVIDSDYLLPLLEAQPTKSAMDFILALLIWKEEGLLSGYDGGMNGLIRFASVATPSEYISRARRVLTNDKPILWNLPPNLIKQSDNAEKSMRDGFSKGNDVVVDEDEIEEIQEIEEEE